MDARTSYLERKKRNRNKEEDQVPLATLININSEEAKRRSKAYTNR